MGWCNATPPSDVSVGDDGVAKNLPLATEWYCKAEAMGYGAGATNAAYQLGTLGSAGSSCLLQMATAGHAVLKRCR